RNETLDVSFVQRGIDFVQHAERAGTAPENGQQQSNTGKRFFAAGQQRNVARLFARWAGDNFDAAFQNVDAFFEDNVCVATAKQLAEQLLEMPFDRFECFGEQPAAVGINTVDDLLQRAFSLR